MSLEIRHAKVKKKYKKKEKQACKMSTFTKDKENDRTE